jgi:hypothetical protein
MKSFTHYIIRDYKTGDEQEITALFGKVFGKEMSIEQWKWKYLIPGNGSIYSKVAEDSSGKIIGHAGAVPLKGVFHKQAMPFFQGVDVMVHSKDRGGFSARNLFVGMMKLLSEELNSAFSPVILYGFPGKRPFIIGERFGVYEKIAHIIDISKHLRRSLFNPYQVRVLDWNDAGLDGLWQELSENFILSVIRDRKYLHWRYGINPFFSYSLLGFFFLGKLKGWAVIRKSENEILAVDLLTNPGSCSGVLRALGNFLLSRGENNVRFWLPVSWRKYFRNYKLRETAIIASNAVWNLPIKTSTVRDNLYYNMGDTDIF